MTTFREPTRELPEGIRTLGSTRLYIHDGEGEICLFANDAEALLEVLLDICPNAQNAVDDWLARERLMIVERGGREP